MWQNSKNQLTSLFLHPLTAHLLL